MAQDWFEKWLDGVASGQATMSRRSLSSIEAHGGLDMAVSIALGRGVHLLQLTDDEGRDIIAASLKPFQTLC